jgi:dTMP kinase
MRSINEDLHDKNHSLWDPSSMYFIAFEGLDGSGKSSILQQLESLLKSLQIDFVVTREPGGTPLGDKIRDLILEKSLHPPTSRTELLLYEASRAQHVDQLIRPALENKKWVLTDRFSASSLAFQGTARGIGWDQVESLNYFATDGLSPDLNVLLDLSVDESEKRRHQRELATGIKADRIESEDRSFHERVRQGFLKAAQLNSEKWLVLDASKSPQVLFQELHKKLMSLGWIPQ